VGTLIDTSVLIAVERGELDLEARLESDPDAADEEEVAMAAISASELLHGVHRLKAGVRRARVETLVEGLLARIPVMPFDLRCARAHAIMSADLRARGQAVGAHDLLIAATAVALDYRVVTRDRRSFPKIRDLNVEYW
jgi:predicted nucleic acid-binding protein